MNYLIAIQEELKLLTRAEENIYRMFRINGFKRDIICEKMGITEATFRKHWRNAQKKISDYRILHENPQIYLEKNIDVLSSKGEVILTSGIDPKDIPETSAILDDDE